MWEGRGEDKWIILLIFCPVWLLQETVLLCIQKNVSCTSLTHPTFRYTRNRQLCFDLFLSSPCEHLPHPHPSSPPSYYYYLYINGSLSKSDHFLRFLYNFTFESALSFMYISTPEHQQFSVYVYIWKQRNKQTKNETLTNLKAAIDGQ